jgi:hypothetical protein
MPVVDHLLGFFLPFLLFCLIFWPKLSFMHGRSKFLLFVNVNRVIDGIQCYSTILKNLKRLKDLVSIIVVTLLDPLIHDGWKLSFQLQLYLLGRISLPSLLRTWPHEESREFPSSMLGKKN